MVKSEQLYELGETWFGKLQGEIAEAPEEARNDFLKAVKSDNMGFCGEEGVDDED